jgi:hypothetical protein
MDTLDEHGRKLYRLYLKAKQEWLDYITPIATDFTLNKIHETGKIYYRYSYLYFKIESESETAERIEREKSFKNVSSELYFDSVKSSEECRTLYKKLALMFHPDKFKVNDNLFKYIKTSYENNDIDVLNQIFNDILIISEKTSEEIDQYIKNIPIIWKENLEDDFTQTTTYKNFTKNKVDLDFYMTHDELVDHIHYGYLSDNEVKYYQLKSETDEIIKIGLLKREIRLRKEEARKLKIDLELLEIEKKQLKENRIELEIKENELKIKKNELKIKENELNIKENL